MKTYLFSTFAILIGILAGYGAVNLSHVARESFSDFNNRESSTVKDFTTNVGSEDVIVTPKISEKISLFNREISFTTQTGGYNKIDKNVLLPKLSAESFYIGDLKTGEMIDAVDQEKIRPIASISKLMTAMVAKRNFNLSEITDVSYTAIAAYGKQGNLFSREKISLIDLLNVLLMQSSNDAAEAIAEFKSRDEFIKMMNTEAERLSLDDTRFEDPSGLSQNNVSTAREVFDLARYIYRSYPEIIEITRTKNYLTKNHSWYNSSVFRNDNRYLGGKSGFTEFAGHTLVSMFKLPIGQNSELREIGIVVLDSDDSEKDMRAIILYLLKNIEYIQI